LSFDISAYYTGRVSFNFIPVEDFSRVDFRLGWKPKENISLSFGVQNSFTNSHTEGTPRITAATPVPRNFYAKAQWKF
ncbi:TonB-dependent receptor, partial [Klebsiella pneumoniae]|nr:TonB-dependent receptor [Klebsiella pneumoniae]